MEGHWWGEGDTKWKDIGGVRGNRMERHWWGEGGHRMEGQSTSFDKADGQHLSDFDATSHI